MKRLNFSVKINAPRERVWKSLFDDATYRQWTTVFCEGSYMESDWKENGKTRFLSPGGDGMFSTIDKKIDNEVMSFKHLGVMKDGKELPPTEETNSWAGAVERYTLTESHGVTELVVDMDITEEHEQYFMDVFPKGLQKVKEIAESAS